MYQKQESCSVTTGGSNYNMALGPQQTFYDGPDTEAVKRFKNGTSAVLTLFYNEPWKNHTTSPVDFLNEPEVHLSCLRKVQTAEKQQFSGSTSLRTSLEGLSLLWLVLCSLLWMGAMV